MSRRLLVIAEDDDDDFLLTVSAMEEAGFAADVVRCRDGEELLDFLNARGHFRDQPPPENLLILLDLNMPRKDGREALKEIKTREALKKYPVVVLTTSKADEDVQAAYALGVNSFIRKPASFEEFVEYARALRKYWFDVVVLPAGGAHGSR